MSTEDGYSGWNNYATWRVALWMDNDEGSYRFFEEQAGTLWKQAKGDKRTFIANYAGFLRQFHEENMPTLPSGVYSDLLGYALQSVDWFEIAESRLGSVTEED
jgi:hypothetical protein